MNCGEKIARLRKQNNMTQAELGEALSVTYQAVSKWERSESLPDFDTISRISKLFQVPISYFEEGGEEQVASDMTATTADSATSTATPIADIIGMCVHCGKVVREGEEETKEPKLICKACAELARQEAERRILAEKRQQELEKQRKQDRDNFAKSKFRKRRNIALIIAAIPAIIVFLMFLIVSLTDAEMIQDKELQTAGIGCAVVFGIVAFTFTSQMIWGGVVRSVCTGGGKILGMPGVIFSLSPDGIIFLIVVKILQFFIVVFVFVASILFCIFLAMFISPFTFIPSLLWRNREIRKATAVDLEEF
ncbi:MAG: helix-turn-helix domain-containing protein [Clostridia bacterium]|nr:helix-turn-helix domain-containing protein [Clostridia bacterium]